MFTGIDDFARETERKLVYEKEKIHICNGETCTIRNIECSIASNAFIGLRKNAHTHRERERVYGQERMGDEMRGK